MAGNDISSLIQDIYDRYKENQKDKKPEEQMYMSEEEFKANLKSMVNKSDIEDKFMLYNEIYLNITEDALEIDTTGNITISPKVIVNAEKEVIRRLEEKKNVEKSKIGITEVVVGKTILDMTKEEYDKLTNEQKRSVFAKSTESLFGSEDLASNAFDLIEQTGVTTEKIEDLDDIIGEIKDNKPLTVQQKERLEAFGIEADVNNSTYLKMQADVQKILSQMINGRFGKILSSSDGEKKYLKPERIAYLSEFAKLNMSMEEKINIIRYNEEFIDLDETEMALVSELLENPKLLEYISKTFVMAAQVKYKLTELLKDVPAELREEAVGIIVDDKSKLGQLQDLPSAIAKLAEAAPIIAEGKNIDKKTPQVVDHLYNEICRDTTYWYGIKDNINDMIAGYLDMSTNPFQTNSQNQTPLGKQIVYEARHGEYTGKTTEDNIVGNASLIGEEKKTFEARLEQTLEELKKSKYANVLMSKDGRINMDFLSRCSEMLRSDIDREQFLSRLNIEKDAFGLDDSMIDVLAKGLRTGELPAELAKFSELYASYRRPENDSIGENEIGSIPNTVFSGLDEYKTLKGTTLKLEDILRAKQTVEEPEITEDVVEMEGDFEAELAAISDMQPDMFAGMFESMAEEMVFDVEQPVVETEKQEQTVPEIDSTEERSDNPISQDKGVQITDSTVADNMVQGIQIEDIAIDEIVTNTMSNENLPKKITWVDKVRASVDAFGKNVKKAFGSFISAITGKGGENNTGTNNTTTTTTSSNAGQNKPVQEVNNFVPTVELNLKQAQQATKAAEEAKKNNDARGTDEPTQDDSEIGE